MNTMSPWYFRWWMRCKISLYRLAWSKTVSVTGSPDCKQPLLIRGQGRILFEPGVRIGSKVYQGYLNTYANFTLRGEDSQIRIGEDVALNNNVSLTADRASIYIGKGTVTGINLSVHTSDRYNTDPVLRHMDQRPTHTVIIGENVFIGDNVMILKGVKIGRNAVIGAGSVVTHSVPENVLAAGNPCRVIRTLT
ncbi:MAG TPA: acetyltransferase [Bacteroidales bacterium]|nr:acetyltransferase [Bacteroidales bacterium]